MKKIIAVIIAALCMSIPVGLLAGCGESLDASYRIVAPDGAPVAALADMWGDDLDGIELDYEITSEANIAGKFVESNPAEFIVAPLNVGANIHLAAVQDKAKADYKLMNVTSWGVLYIITTEGEYKNSDDCLNTEDFLDQFDGKTLTTIGLQAIPGKSVAYLMGDNVTLAGSDAATIQQSVRRGDPMTAVLGEPAITALRKNGADFRVLCSVTEVYADVTGDEFPMAGTFVRADIADSDPSAVEKINARISASVDKFNEDPLNVGNKANQAGSTLSGIVLKDAAPRMNVKFKNAAESKSDAIALLSRVGVNVEDDFFV